MKSWQAHGRLNCVTGAMNWRPIDVLLIEQLRGLLLMIYGIIKRAFCLTEVVIDNVSVNYVVEIDNANWERSNI